MSPPAQPRIEPYRIEYGRGFYGLEKDAGSFWNWSNGQSLLRVYQNYFPPSYSGGNTSLPASVTVRFGVESLIPRTVWIEVAGKRTVILEPGALRRDVTLTVPASELRQTLALGTDQPPGLPGNGDMRMLAFRIINLRLEEGRP